MICLSSCSIGLLFADRLDRSRRNAGNLPEDATIDGIGYFRQGETGANHFRNEMVFIGRGLLPTRSTLLKGFTVVVPPSLQHATVLEIVPQNIFMIAMGRTPSSWKRCSLAGSFLLFEQALDPFQVLTIDRSRGEVGFPSQFPGLAVQVPGFLELIGFFQCFAEAVVDVG